MESNGGSLRHSETIALERNDPTIVMLFLLGAQLLILFLLGAAFYLSTIQAREAAEEARKGVVCLIEQLAEHRYAQRAAHEADAANHGYVYEVPQDVKAPTIEQLEATRRRLSVSCDDFLPPVVRVP